MGCAHSRSSGAKLVFSVPITPIEDAVGESQVYRAPETKNGLNVTVLEDPTIRTVQDVYIKSFEKHPNSNFLSTREPSADKKLGPYVAKTYAQVQDIATRLGSGIVNLDLASHQKDDKGREVEFLLIWSKNREEWLMADIACCLYNIALIPVYDTLGPETMSFICGQTEARTIFASSDHIDAIVAERARIQTLKNVVIFGDVTEDQRKKLEGADLKCYSYQDILTQGENKQKYRRVQPEDFYTVNYTSGTTGLPKGVIITHKNQVAASASVLNRDDLGFGPHDSYLSYLPLAHTLERTAVIVFAMGGAHIGFYNGDVQRIKDDLQEFKPTVFVSVPRLFTRFYEKMQEGLDKLTGMKKSLATRAVETKLENLVKYGAIQHGIYDSLVFGKMKQALGGRVRIMVTGSAPIETAVQNFLRVAVGVPLLEGYGQTETSAASFIARAEVPTFGHVGAPLGCIEFKVVDVPEMNYTAKDRDATGALTPRGEICMRGPSVFQGYYRDAEKTAETIDKDGWVHSGDIGRINPDGSLSIIDRKKNIFKLAQGEYVASEKVENVYLTSKYIAEAFLYGDSFKSYTVAICVPHKDGIMQLGKELGIENASFEELCKNKDVIAKVLADINKKGKDSKINSFELAKKLYLEPVSFGEHQLMTPTFKLIRHQAKNHYQKVIDQLYEAPL